MTSGDPSLTIGIEEEYLLVDLATRDLAEDPPPELMKDCEAKLAGRVTSEFMRCQIEVETSVCTSIDEARGQLADLRHTIAACAAKYGLAPIAASTHPFAEWDRQRRTAKERYLAIANDMQYVARRMVISGMHVHLGIEDEPLRFDLLSQLSYFLPHLLALSTSSPFWRGENTGLHSYRLSVFDELPRTGLPPAFTSPDEYHRTVAVLVGAGEIEDATKIWWDMRPSARFPTVEMRITDMCPRLDDAITVAALFRCIARMLARLRRDNQRWRSYSNFLINENRWLAQRYGTTGDLIDFGRGASVPFGELASELLELIAEDAAFLGCEADVARAAAIARDGTSADRQIGVYEQAKTDGADEREALAAVVDHLVSETQMGCAPG